MTLVAEVVQQDEARAAHPRIFVFERRAAQQREVDDTAGAQRRELAGVRSDAAVNELFDLASLGVVEHGPKVARQASYDHLITHAMGQRPPAGFTAYDVSVGEAEMSEPAVDESEVTEPAVDESTVSEAAISEPEVPSPVPVEGWARGIDGNWWPPAPPRRRPTPTARSSAPPASHHRRRIGGALALIIIAIAILAIVAAIAAVLAWYDDKPARSIVSEAAHVVAWVATTRG